MKNIEREIDTARGFDLIVAKTNEIIAHFNTHEEATIAQRGHDGWYIRYFLKTDCEKKDAEPSSEKNAKASRKVA